MKSLIIRNIYLFVFIIFIIFLKVCFYFLLASDLISFDLFGGSDADSYHLHAIGQVEIVTTSWPIILRFLYEKNLYSRELVSSILVFINIFIIPVLMAKICNLNLIYTQKKYFYCILLCSIYPTLYFYSLDVFRDVVMVLFFLVGCLIIKKIQKNYSAFNLFFLYSLSILLGFILFSFRPYLGYAFLLALVLWKIKFTKKRIFLFSVLYFLALLVLNVFGVFDYLLEYRSAFEEVGGGSTLGLDFSNSSMFIPNLILSALGQLFGLFITTPLALTLFFIETIPFIFMFIYVVKNIKYADSFIGFLLIFFVLYASVWLIGNDNLGTAVRLRLYNYFAIYICFFYIMNLKQKALCQPVSKI